MKFPTIHLNGTGGEALMSDLIETNNALRAAIAALEKMAPNGRDYYPQGNDAISEASKEHRARIDALVGGAARDYGNCRARLGQCENLRK